MNPIRRQILNIRSDRSHGASFLAVEALNILEGAIAEAPRQGFLPYLIELGQELMAARPIMAPLVNNVARLLYEVQAKPPEDPGSLRDFAARKVAEIRDSYQQSLARAAEQGAQILGSHDRIITCSYSSMVCSALRLAREQGKHIRVIIAESRAGARRFSELTARELEQNRIAWEVIPDEAIPENVSRAEKAMVGADTVLPDGSLINGTPSLKLALAARGGIPFHSVCETAKFVLEGKTTALEKGFDHIPADLITAVVTEEGPMRPEDIPNYVKEKTALARMSPNPLSYQG